MRILLVIAWVVSAATPGHSQGDGKNAFEVASIKSNNSDSDASNSSRIAGSRFTATNATLVQLLRSAYAVQVFQIEGGPAWIGVDRFDIAATIPSGHTPGEWPLMLQELLATRFRLVLRKTTRDVNGYALSVVGRTPKLTAVAASRCVAPNTDCGMSASPAQIVARGQSMDQLAARLSRSIGEPVVNQTGITGIYDFTVQWTEEERFRLPGASASPSIFTALSEQLGLRLRSQRVPMDTLVIESVEHPTPD